jgi:hypothetical protein
LQPSVVSERDGDHALKRVSENAESRRAVRPHFLNIEPTAP